MKNERLFLRCGICGNIVGMIENSGVQIHCCNKPMTPMAANTADASKEKHVPKATLKNGRLTVTVGSALHPQTKEHHIAWIAAAQGALMQRMTLDTEGAPETVFLLDKNEPATVFAYCNLHGLWSAEVLPE